VLVARCSREESPTERAVEASVTISRIAAAIDTMLLTIIAVGSVFEASSAS